MNAAPRALSVALGGGAHALPGGLLWLGDVLAVPAPLPADVISAGDLCIALGLLLFVAAAMASEPPASGAMPS